MNDSCDISEFEVKYIVIPKVIHYCWFGHGQKPKLAEKCIRSWKKYCPDYQIIEWNEENFDLSASPLYVRQAYEAKKWAFVTDYVWLDVVYQYGGIYMDTDVELKKPLDMLLERSAYFGFENGNTIATGLGFGAEKGIFILKELMDDYVDIPFVKKDGTYDLLPCPQRNINVFLKYGIQLDNSMQVLPGNILILPSIYLCPIDSVMKIRTYSHETISIHWFDASWQDNRKQMHQKQRIDLMIYYFKQGVKYIIGEKVYERLKKLYRRGFADASN